MKLNSLLPLGSLLLAGLGLSPATGGAAESRDEKVRKDREQFAATETWIYNDLAQGWALARDTGRPLLVVLRCVP